MKLTVALLLMLFGLVHCEPLRNECPAADTITPCFCKSIGTTLVIDCADFTSLKKLENVIHGLEGYDVYQFRLVGGNLGDLPSAAFRGLETKEIHLAQVALMGMGDSLNRPPFMGLEDSLEVLNVTSAFTDEKSPLTGFSVPHLRKLVRMTLESNIIPRIGNDWFESGPYSLSELYIRDSSTKQLGNLAFFPLRNLKHIAVTGGSISVIQRMMLPSPADHLESLDLSANAISTLPEDIFKSMPSLEKVNLRGNALNTINEPIWSYVWHQLSSTNFEGNPINCDGKMKWIYQYRLPEELLGACAGPKNLQSKELKSLTVKDFS